MFIIITFLIWSKKKKSRFIAEKTKDQRHWTIYLGPTEESRTSSPGTLLNCQKIILLILLFYYYFIIYYSDFIDSYRHLTHCPETCKPPTVKNNVVSPWCSKTVSIVAAREQDDDFLNNLIQKGVLHFSYFIMKVPISIIEMWNLRNQLWKINSVVASLWLVIVFFSCMLIAWSPMVAWP